MSGMPSCSSQDTAVALAYLRHAQTLLAMNQTRCATALLEQATAWLQARFAEAPLHLPCRCWSVGVGLDTGQRSVNEDYPFAVTFDMPDVRQVQSQERTTVGIFAVADGMGGHAHGDVAATCAVHTFIETLLPRLLVCRATVFHELRALLTEGVQAANRAVYARNRQVGADGRKLMGTTLTTALCVGSLALIANVGDSRTYLFRQGVLSQLSSDHSYVFDQVAAGRLAPDQLYTHPRRNEIYRCLGETEEVAVDLFRRQLLAGDCLLLCSDGLWEMVPDPSQLAAVLASPQLSPTQMAQRLVQLALAGGGRDNIGLIVARYQPDPCGNECVPGAAPHP